MKKNNIIAYVIVGTACIGSYIMGHIDGFKNGYKKGCTECTKLLKEVLEEHKLDKSKETKKK